MSQVDMYEDLCKKCFIRLRKPSKKEIKKMVMTDYKETCDCCGKTDFVVEYVED